MRILEVLTYYRPHISGLTIYVERLSRALAAQGHEVTVLTSQYDHRLPRRESAHGVNIIRVPVAARVSKGVLMPTFGLRATQLVWQADVLHLHLPQFDAPGLALRGRLFGKPVVLTYHSDLQLPPGAFNRLVNRVVDVANRAAGALADAVVTYTGDFGRHSPYLSRYRNQKLHIIPPPVALAPATDADRAAFRAKHNLDGKKVIGFTARMAAEKGVEVLLEALPQVLARYPEAHVLHAGPVEEVIGEQAYAARLAPLLARHAGHYHLLGPLEGPEFTAFYQNLDCLVICSLNNTETFGLVQIEAMLNGVPSIASNLPGVRRPVQMTGMGEIVPVGDAAALASAINQVLADPAAYRRDPTVIAAAFAPEATAVAYLELFRALQAGTPLPPAVEPAAYQRLQALGDNADSPG